MVTLIAEPVDAPNPAIAPLFQVGRGWRGVGDPCLAGSELLPPKTHEAITVLHRGQFGWLYRRSKR